MRYLWLITLLYSFIAGAQEVPEAPKPQTKLDMSLFAARVAARSLDVTSTNHALGSGGHENELPPWIANNTAALIGFEASVIGVEMLGERELRRHGHRKLARLVPLIDAAAVSVTVARNYAVGPANAPQTVTFRRWR